MFNKKNFIKTYRNSNNFNKVCFLNINLKFYFLFFKNFRQTLKEKQQILTASKNIVQSFLPDIKTNKLHSVDQGSVMSHSPLSTSTHDDIQDRGFDSERGYSSTGDSTYADSISDVDNGATETRPTPELFLENQVYIQQQLNDYDNGSTVTLNQIEDQVEVNEIVQNQLKIEDEMLNDQKTFENLDKKYDYVDKINKYNEIDIKQNNESQNNNNINIYKQDFVTTTINTETNKYPEIITRQYSIKNNNDINESTDLNNLEYKNNKEIKKEIPNNYYSNKKQENDDDQSLMSDYLINNNVKTEDKDFVIKNKLQEIENNEDELIRYITSDKKYEENNEKEIKEKNNLHLSLENDIIEEKVVEPNLSNENFSNNINNVNNTNNLNDLNNENLKQLNSEQSIQEKNELQEIKNDETFIMQSNLNINELDIEDQNVKFNQSTKRDIDSEIFDKKKNSIDKNQYLEHIDDTNYNKITNINLTENDELKNYSNCNDNQNQIFINDNNICNLKFDTEKNIIESTIQNNISKTFNSSEEFTDNEKKKIQNNILDNEIESTDISQLNKQETTKSVNILDEYNNGKNNLNENLMQNYNNQLDTDEFFEHKSNSDIIDHNDKTHQIDYNNLLQQNQINYDNNQIVNSNLLQFANEDNQKNNQKIDENLYNFNVKESNLKNDYLTTNEKIDNNLINEISVKENLDDKFSEQPLINDNIEDNFDQSEIVSNISNVSYINEESNHKNEFNDDNNNFNNNKESNYSKNYLDLSIDNSLIITPNNDFADSINKNYVDDNIIEKDQNELELNLTNNESKELLSELNETIVNTESQENNFYNHLENEKLDNYKYSKNDKSDFNIQALKLKEPDYIEEFDLHSNETLNYNLNKNEINSKNKNNKDYNSTIYSVENENHTNIKENIYEKHKTSENNSITSNFNDNNFEENNKLANIVNISDKNIDEEIDYLHEKNQEPIVFEAELINKNYILDSSNNSTNAYNNDIDKNSDNITPLQLYDDKSLQQNIKSSEIENATSILKSKNNNSNNDDLLATVSSESINKTINLELFTDETNKLYDSNKIDNSVRFLDQPSIEITPASNYGDSHEDNLEKIKEIQESDFNNYSSENINEV